MIRVYPIPLPTQPTVCGYFGDPRPNGRTHKGVDLCCKEGTPLVAVEDGDLRMDTDPLGGLVLYLKGASGDVTYYAHLSRQVGEARPVRAGDLVGYVGHTGDAQATLPHLHIESHPGGGPAVDPLPALKMAEHTELAKIPLPKTALGAVLAAAGTLTLVGALGWAFAQEPRRR